MKKKPEHSTGKAGKKRTFTSRVTSGLRLLPSVDGRSHVARIMRDTYESMLSHCGGGDDIPETKRLMARRVAAMEAELINLECRFALARTEGKQPSASDLDLYTRLSGAQRRCCEALGWQRTPRDITPTLTEYMRLKAAEKEAA